MHDVNKPPLIRVARLWKASPTEIMLDYWVSSMTAIRVRVRNKAEAEEAITETGVGQRLEDETTEDGTHA